MDITKQRRRIQEAQQAAARAEADAAAAASKEAEERDEEDTSSSDATSSIQAVTGPLEEMGPRKKKEPDVTAQIAKRMMLNNHAHESVRDIMLESSVFDVPHAPPKKKKNRPKTSYGHGCTFYSAPGTVFEEVNTDLWEDEISEMGYQSLARKCAVSPDMLKALHEDWKEITKNKKKGMQQKPFQKIIEKWFPNLDKVPVRIPFLPRSITIHLPNPHIKSTTI